MRQGRPGGAAADELQQGQHLQTLAESPFVTSEGTELRLDGQPYRFTGLNVYNANSRGECWYALASGPGLDEALTEMGPGTEVIRAWFFESLATTGGERDWSALRPHAGGGARPTASR